MEGDTKYADGHYEMPFPFRNDDVLMSDNRGKAIAKPNLLKKKLSKDDNLRQDYVKFMNNFLQKGYARRVPSDCPTPEEGKVSHLPHHGVYHAKKPDKIRVVFDCSARFRLTSLNDQLLQGPDLTNSLVGVLTRIRKSQAVFMADIESMFY